MEYNLLFFYTVQSDCPSPFGETGVLLFRPVDFAECTKSPRIILL